MDPSKLKYVYLIILSLIWGSSFILIKKALGEENGELVLQPLQLGAARTIISGTILIIIGWKSFISTDKKDWPWLAVSGLLGTFFPAFLFAYAQTEIDSAISAILNSTVPLISLIMGAVIFGISFSRNQLIGVIIGLAGAIGLVIAGMESHPNQNYLFAGLILIACVCYASNVNIIKKYLQNINPLAIATGNFIFIVPLAIIVFFSSDGHSIEFNDSRVQESFLYIIVLCLFGTVAAKIMFNKLVQMTSPVFATSVTYLMPVIGLTWGVLDGEFFNVWQGVATAVIIFAVVLVTREKKKA
ncbi:drug/metabolite transporter (DMT)-like permease [Nonlabens dokdonensis]|jgi:drug/metabolite transporter (DMT)-like permease|uniref:Drug/metabolite transporter (DMT)-like permease n=2 Tax=Nonlabens dokdonensis TaxID=328515 RepID=A0ABX5Q2R6_9FLAO|nr:DMT family transporter [Nonlabens dokdonensis]AGC76696.1 putative permease [Nonlabens dokdonensis DSW-6]PZX44344.1 drug/metabolite transporter (DMT)-like permease [Nonlabens dokdonensis]